MLFAINVTGLHMLTMGTVSELPILAIMGSVGNVAGYSDEETRAILEVGGKIELEASGCKMVVDVWRNCVGQLADSNVIEIYASLVHCMHTGSEWQFHVFRERDEMMEMQEARTQSVHLSDEIDDDIDRLHKQIEALEVKRKSVGNNIVRLDKMIAEKEADK